MRRFLATAAVALTVGAASFVAAPAADATTGKCKGNMCAYVVGKGRYVERMKFSVKVHYHDYADIYFTVSASKGGWHFKTGDYVWHATHDDRLALGQTFYTHHYYPKRTFPNNTRLTITSHDLYGSSRYHTTISSITIHS